MLLLSSFLSSSLPVRVREDANDDDDDEKEEGLPGPAGPPCGLGQLYPSTHKRRSYQ